MTPDQKADAAKAVAFARRVLQLAAREQRARKMTDRAAVAGLIDAARHIMAGAGCSATEIAEHLRSMARSVEVQAGVLRNVQ